MNEQTPNVFTSRQLITEFNERMKAISKGNEIPECIPSGYYFLDKALGGFQKGKLHIIGARPGMGKIAFMVNLVQNMILDPLNPSKVVVLTPDISAQQLMQRLVSCASGIMLEKFTTGAVGQHEWLQLKNSINRISQASLIVDETVFLSVESLEEKCATILKDNGSDILIIDYMQLLSPQKRQYRVKEVALVLHKLKELARKFSIAVVVMAELNKAPENKKASNRMPQLSDLRECGFTDQEADVVLFLYRPEYYDKTQSEYGGSLTWEAHIHIAKNGMGPLETIRLKALFHIQKFIEYDEDLFYEGEQT